MSGFIPYGQHGPDRRFKITPRLGRELDRAANGLYLKSVIDDGDLIWLRQITLDALGCPSGTTVNLGIYTPKEVELLRDVLRTIEQRCCHDQVQAAAKRRRYIIDDYLGVSAVDRLGDVM